MSTEIDPQQNIKNVVDEAREVISDLTTAADSADSADSADPISEELAAQLGLTQSPEQVEALAKHYEKQAREEYDMKVAAYGYSCIDSAEETEFTVNCLDDLMKTLADTLPVKIAAQWNQAILASDTVAQAQIKSNDQNFHLQEAVKHLRTARAHLINIASTFVTVHGDLPPLEVPPQLVGKV